VPVIADADSSIDNKSLCKAAHQTLSMGSTLGVESAAWGTPAAYYQRGWDTSRIESIMDVLPVPRLKDRQGLVQFIQSHCTHCGSQDGSGPMNVENCNGAIAAAWESVRGLL